MSNTLLSDPQKVTVRRVIRASVERAFDAWTDPASLQNWFGPPGFRAEVLTHDLHVGGTWRFRMISADGAVAHHFGKFIEISPSRRLVFTWASEEQVEGWRDEDGQPTRVAVDFTPRADGVEICVTHEHLQSEDARRSLSGGWDGSLESLNDHLVKWN